METVTHMSGQGRKRTGANIAATRMAASVRAHIEPSTAETLVSFPHAATAEQMAFLESELAAARRIISSQQSRIEKLENLTLSDELTGLYNRRGFYHMLGRELEHTHRHTERRGAVMMIDLDDFKQINDEHGHQAGDAYLKAVAARLKKLVRSNDHVCRLGGDEFAVIFTDIEPATAIMRATVIERAFGTQHMEWKGQKLPLRASFGTTIFQRGDAIDELMSAADLKLYANKVRKKKLWG